MVEHEKYERIFSIVVFAGGLFLLDWRDECKIPCLMVDLKKWAFIGIRNAKWYFPARARLEFIFDVGFYSSPWVQNVVIQNLVFLSDPLQTHLVLRAPVLGPNH